LKVYIRGYNPQLCRCRKTSATDFLLYKRRRRRRRRRSKKKAQKRERKEQHKVERTAQLCPVNVLYLLSIKTSNVETENKHLQRRRTLIHRHTFEVWNPWRQSAAVSSEAQQTLIVKKKQTSEKRTTENNSTNWSALRN
jgi:hypothetical protein